MTVLTRWNPYRELNALQNSMNRLFDSQFGGRDESLTTGAFVPAVDVYEDEHSVQLKLEVPGVAEKDLDIRVENNTLTVSGEKHKETHKGILGDARVERSYGAFRRILSLPDDADRDAVTAFFRNGVLTITCPRRMEAGEPARQIEIQKVA